MRVAAGHNTGMERESDKHSPRVDEAMKQDVESLLKGAPVESRAQESRLQEDPDVGPGTRTDVPDPPGSGIPETAADRRAEIARHLATVRFPASREELVAAARDDGASPQLLRELQDLDEEGPFETVQAVWTAMGGESESPHTR